MILQKIHAAEDMVAVAWIVLRKRNTVYELSKSEAGRSSSRTDASADEGKLRGSCGLERLGWVDRLGTVKLKSYC
jgi:hypothetical protein